VAAPHIPPPVGPKYPWWAGLFSPNWVRLVVYYGATIFAFFCLWYGVTRLDKPNFDTPPRPACSQCISTAPDSGSEKPFSNYARWRIGFLFFWIALPPAWF